MNELYKDQTQPPDPRPLRKRVCACGCQYTFQPGRKDQIYLNRQHANYAYNHGKRKKKKEIQLRVERALAKNDDILHKHYQSENQERTVIRYLDVLRADGFNLRYTIGFIEIKKVMYTCTYRYYYCISQKEPKQVKIYKR